MQRSDTFVSYKKRLFGILAAFVLINQGCNENTTNQISVPKHVTMIIDYFDSNRIKEYQQIEFEKKVNWGGDSWTIADSNYISYAYMVGYASAVDENYKFPVSDSLERICIFNIEMFTRRFPLTHSLPDDNIDMIQQKGDLIVCKRSWSNNYDKKAGNLFKPEAANVLFKGLNPFEYFKSRTKEMDSLGVESIGGHSFGNVISIRLAYDTSYLHYLPSNLEIHENYQRIFDSVTATGIRLNKNWVWKQDVTIVE